MRTRYIFNTLLIFVLLLSAGGCGWLSPSQPSPSPNPNENGQSAAPAPSSLLLNSPAILGTSNIADIVEKVSPAVVNIETTTTVNGNDVFFNNEFFREFFGNDGRLPQPNVQTGVGTGFIISSDGYILTNQHVIDGASKIVVRMADSEQGYDATVVGQDYELDLAIIKVEANKTLTTLNMGDSDRIRVGDWVVAIGNPYGLDHTVTVGVISAKGRPISIENRVYRNLIQTDAAINPGNSGGPLLNTSGEVVGINTAVNYEAQGIGFAISINTAKEIIDELIRTGKVVRPYIGVWLEPMNEAFAARFNIANSGVIVANVIAGGPAEKAGIQVNDVIVSLNGTTIKDYEGLQDFLQTRKVGETITVEIIRNGNTLSIPVTLAEKPQNSSR
ncbi:MAG TPA: trypsin-like peptidase domain-containing protein [Syntrophomonadaceae bacterium]|nr:trypsin-like peptidase domain-containing protein [Syntrophomonadaceae bacterium]